MANDTPMIAALFVDAGGIYAGRPNVEVWDKARDARLYDGPHPVVAHPPCERWGRWWWADGSDQPGNDGGCFAAALEAVERCGGVIEHPAHSHAFAFHRLPMPPPDGRWASNLYRPGVSAQVEQGHYGHRARKATWLYYVGDSPPELTRGASVSRAYLCRPGRTKTKPGRADVDIIGAVEARATPPAFAEMLLSMARPCLYTNAAALAAKSPQRHPFPMESMK